MGAPRVKAAATQQGRPGSRCMTVAAAVAALALAAAYAYYFIFSRALSLDEGYLMITIQGFNGGHALYDSVFTQYGPFYYCYEWIARTLIGIPLTHDATRLLCVFHWLLAAALLGFAGWRITRSWLVAIFVAAQAVVHLSPMAHEPGHPQELIVLLLAAGTVAATCWRSKWTWPVLGATAACLAFTKINVGAFFGFALLLALRCHAADRFARRPVIWMLTAVNALLPFLLMRGHLSLAWCQSYAVVAATATAGTFFVAQRFATNSDIARGLGSYLRIGIGFFAVAVVLTLVALFTGSSVHGLLDGLVITPLRTPKVALLGLETGRGAMLSALAAIACAAIVLRRKDQPPMAMFIVLLKSLFAVAGAFCLIGDARHQLGLLLPWVWLVVVHPNSQPAPQGTDAEQNVAGHFSRTFLALAAAWQSLQGYPIAGTQITLGTLLLVLAYGVCLHDATTGLAEWIRIRRQIAIPHGHTRTLLHALACVALLLVFANFWCALPKVRREYASLPALDLPGSQRIHTDPEVVAMYQSLSAYLAAECDTFVTYPGVNSLYFWAGKQPPTQLNSTGWGLLSHAQQEQILGSLSKASRPRLAVVEAQMQGWDDPAYEPIRPLVRFVTGQCRPLKRIGRFIVFEPRPSLHAAAER